MLLLLAQHVVNCDTSVLCKTRHFHHQLIVMVAVAMLKEDFLPAFLYDSQEVKLEQWEL